MVGGGEGGYVPRDLRWEVQPKHIFWSLVLCLAIAGYALIAADPVPTEPPATVTVLPPEQPVDSVTSEALEAIRVLLGVIERQGLTPAEREALEAIEGISEGVEDGTVTLEPDPPPRDPPPAPPPTTRPPRPTTTTTTTTTPPPGITVPDLGDLIDITRGDFTFTPTTVP